MARTPEFLEARPAALLLGGVRVGLAVAGSGATHANQFKTNNRAATRTVLIRWLVRKISPG